MKTKKCMFFIVLLSITLPKISIANCNAARIGCFKLDPVLNNQLVPMYLPTQHKEFKTLFECGSRREYMASQRLIALEKRRKSWPVERRKNYHAQLDAAEATLTQLNTPCKNRALTNLRIRINALKDRINLLPMTKERV